MSKRQVSSVVLLVCMVQICAPKSTVFALFTALNPVPVIVITSVLTPEAGVTDVTMEVTHVENVKAW